ncbi:FtsX-like permease family protein [uncultured Clostridium sp.]|uniref:ABC transporter permease n=1 Tax=uncultured Clostridium sp. TaxID=59620 RepID=UPI00262968CE|nr:FtsX-like permease family protein [uncultured Clostridium sp.]
MESYTKIINKNSNKSKRKNIYANFGIILTYILFVSLVGTLCLFNNILKENAYKRSGSYTVVISGLKYNKFDTIENNVQVKTSGRIKNVENSTVEGEKEKINLFSLDETSMEKLVNKRIDLLSGKYPLGKNEIMITERAEKIFNKKIGDYIVVNGDKYKIVGSYTIFHSEQPNIEGMTTNNINDVKDDKDYLLIQLKNNRKKEKFVETVKRYNPDANISYNKAITDYNKEGNVLYIIDIVVNIFCIYLIYCTLNLRVRENKRDLIILRYIGCTREKIMYMTFKRNYKLLIYTSIVGSILGLIVFRFSIAPVIMKISRGLGGITEDIKMRGFNIIFLQIVILTGISLLISIYKLPIYKKNIVESLTQEKGKLKLSKRGVAKKSYDYFLANRVVKINKNHRRVVFLGVSLIVILFSLSTSLYYLSIKNNKMNEKKEIVLTRSYDRDGLEQSSKVIQYISKIPGVKSMRGSGIINLKVLGEESDGKDLILGKGNQETKNNKDAQLIICNPKRFKNLKDKIKESDMDSINTAILMKNNYSMTYGLNKNGKINLKGKNNEMTLNVIGSIKTENLKEYDKKADNRQLRILISLDTVKNHEQLFENNLDRVAIIINISNISELNYFNIKNEALKNGMLFTDKIEKGQQNVFFFKTSLLLGYLGIITIIMIIIVNIINNEYILAENRKKEFATMLLLGMERKRLKKILIMESLLLWKNASICGGIISIIGITIQFIYYSTKGSMSGVVPPYWAILIIIILLLPIIIIGKLLGIKDLDFKNLAKISKQGEEL